MKEICNDNKNHRMQSQRDSVSNSKKQNTITNPNQLLRAIKNSRLETKEGLKSNLRCKRDHQINNPKLRFDGKVGQNSFELDLQSDLF